MVQSVDDLAQNYEEFFMWPLQGAIERLVDIKAEYNIEYT